VACSGAQARQVILAKSTSCQAGQDGPARHISDAEKFWKKVATYQRRA
jgi:hypothetical protein